MFSQDQIVASWMAMASAHSCRPLQVSSRPVLPCLDNIVYPYCFSNTVFGFRWAREGWIWEGSLATPTPDLPGLVSGASGSKP